MHFTHRHAYFSGETRTTREHTGLNGTDEGFSFHCSHAIPYRKNKPRPVAPEVAAAKKTRICRISRYHPFAKSDVKCPCRLRLAHSVSSGQWFIVKSDLKHLGHSKFNITSMTVPMTCGDKESVATLNDARVPAIFIQNILSARSNASDPTGPSISRKQINNLLSSENAHATSCKALLDFLSAAREIVRFVSISSIEPYQRVSFNNVTSVCSVHRLRQI
jgi:hypothetical protein